MSVVDGEALPIVEAIPEQGDAFNFEAPLRGRPTGYVCPAEIGAAETAAVNDVAVRT